MIEKSEIVLIGNCYSDISASHHLLACTADNDGAENSGKQDPIVMHVLCPCPRCISELMLPILFKLFEGSGTV